MKEKKIFDAITDIDDKLIDEATVIRKKKNTYLYKLLPVAACLMLVLGFLIFNGNRNESIEGALMDVVFPKAFAFDDSDARHEMLDSNVVDDSFIDAVNAFSYETASRLLTKNKGNINYSPVSMYYALALATTGAEGETRNEMLDLLGVGDTATLSTQSRYLYNRLYRDNNIIKSHINNSLWLNNAENFNEGFVNNAASNFYAHVFNEDFVKAETSEKMSEWVALNSGNTITPDIQISPQQIMSIFNTIYFSTQWTDEFDKNKTEEDVFYLDNGDTVNVDYLNSRYASYRYVVGDNYISSSLSLKDGASMFFVLPDEGISPRDLLTNAKDINAIINNNNAYAGEVTWQIPKFDFNSNIKIAETMKQLGVISAFDENADFSGITDGIAYIDDILQETHIAIDEKGVTASAFTQIDYAGAMRPEGRADMILNRPFIFGIEYGKTLLFIGICDNPAE